MASGVKCFFQLQTHDNSVEKPFSQACENNKQPIGDVLGRCLRGSLEVLEVGSGTGQHAVYLAERFPQWRWQCSDLLDNHAGINGWLSEADLNNIQAPLELDVTGQWPAYTYDAVFSANTLHIMSWDSVPYFFQGASQCLKTEGLLLVYGPFNYNGTFTSDSNMRFNEWLKQQNPVSAIRDFERVNQLAEQNGLILQEDNAMPANNRLLVWRKI